MKSFKFIKLPFHLTTVQISRDLFDFQRKKPNILRLPKTRKWSKNSWKMRFLYFYYHFIIERRLINSIINASYFLMFTIGFFCFQNLIFFLHSTIFLIFYFVLAPTTMCFTPGYKIIAYVFIIIILLVLVSFNSRNKLWIFVLRYIKNTVISIKNQSNAYFSGLGW